MSEEGFQITPRTKLKEIIDRYPDMRIRMAAIHPTYKQLQTPLARVMLPIATVEMIAKRAGFTPEELIKKIYDQIDRISSENI